MIAIKGVNLLGPYKTDRIHALNRKLSVSDLTRSDLGRIAGPSISLFRRRRPCDKAREATHGDLAMTPDIRDVPKTRELLKLA